MFVKNNDFHIEIGKDNVLLKSGEYLINSLQDLFIIVDVVEIIDNTLNLSLWFRSSCDYDNLRIQAIKKTDNENEIFEGVFFDYPTTNRYPQECLGYCWIYDYSCDLKIPLYDFKDCELTFKLIYEEEGKHVEIKNPLQFQNYDAGLSKVSNYLIKDDLMVIYDDKNESLKVRQYAFLKSLSLEAISILKMIKDQNRETLPAIF